MKEKKVKNGITYVILGIMDVMILFPVIWMFFVCFKTNNEIFSSLSLFPQGWSPEALIKGWKTAGTYTYTQYSINTFALVAPATLLILVPCSIAAYGFAKSDFPGNQFLPMVLIATLVLPNAIIIIPKYALFNKPGWLDSHMIFYAPAAAGCYPFFVFIMVRLLKGFSRDSDESVYTDGCDPFQCFIQILLSLPKPALFSTGLFQFLWTWNDFLNTNIYTNTVLKFPLSLVLRVSIDVTSNIQWNQVMSVVLVSVIPLILLFFAAQKHFVEGIITSDLRG